MKINANFNFSIQMESKKEKEPDSPEKDFVSGEIAKAQVEAQKGRGAKVVEYLNQIIDLKPNLFGFGLNINKILEKLRKPGRDSQ